MGWEDPSEHDPGAPARAYDHPVQLTCSDDLQRSRLTVFFRLLLAIPHILWVVIWGVAVFFMAIGNWLATLLGPTSPQSLHDFLARYLRYETHVYAYLTLTANPYPGFGGRPGSYPIEVEVAPPAPQNRWKTGFRLILAIPVLIFGGALTGFGGSGSASQGSGFRTGGGALWSSAFLGWFAALFTGRMPRSLRDLNLYALRYGAQAAGYLLILTDHYPDADPDAPPAPGVLAPHPVTLSLDDDLRRSRLTVFFRVLLVIPHLVWLMLWSVPALLAVIVGWFVTLFNGTNSSAIHLFLIRYTRYATHVYAYLTLAANPFPGFVGAPDSYPLDLHFDPPERQNRWKTGFRLILALPALLLSSALGGILLAAAILGWFTGLFVARMPRGLERSAAYTLRYSAQLYAYLFLLTDRYPDVTPGIGE
jgi:Domain of unknown function (DUF4389)